jgi:hypothetical protein
MDVLEANTRKHGALKSKTGHSKQETGNLGRVSVSLDEKDKGEVETKHLLWAVHPCLNPS